MLELNTFVKNKKNLPTGGQAKLFIRSGKVKVNGQIEKRNKFQLKTGYTVTIENETYEITEET